MNMIELFPNWRDECMTTAFWEPLLKEGLRRNHKEFNKEILTFCAVRLGMTQIETILKTAESPIESWLMTWTYFAFFMYDPFSMMVLNSVNMKTMEEHLKTKVLLEELVGDDHEKIIDAAHETLDSTEFANYLIADFYDRDDLLIVIPQVQLDDEYPKLKGMRFDYLIYSDSKDNQKPLIIECDGYEYHKESFINDRKRDRAIRASGLEIMRFSGSEIYVDPIKISFDILDYFMQAKSDG